MRLRAAMRPDLGRVGAPLTPSGRGFKEAPSRGPTDRAQVVELVDALASGASGLTAVKVRVLSWAPCMPTPVILLNAGRRKWIGARIRINHPPHHSMQRRAGAATARLCLHGLVFAIFC